MCATTAGAHLSKNCVFLLTKLLVFRVTVASTEAFSPLRLKLMAPNWLWWMFLYHQPATIFPCFQFGLATG